jgi:hypothetical protein
VRHGTPPSCSSVQCCCLRAVLFVRKKRRSIERRKRKEKKLENFLNLKIFRDKNKRQFMKLVKIIFLKERYMPNYK